jgi:hypothetical protein
MITAGTEHNGGGAIVCVLTRVFSGMTSDYYKSDDCQNSRAVEGVLLYYVTIFYAIQYRVSGFIAVIFMRAPESELEK